MEQLKRNYRIKSVPKLIELDIDTDYRSGKLPTEIDLLVDELIKFKNNGATHIKFDGQCYDYELDLVSFHPVIIEYESDEDFEKRKENERIRLLNQEQLKINQEIELFHRLKQKYNL